jgi:hypothetical protein
MRAVKNGMLFILDTIISLTQITSWGGPGAPRCGFKAKSVNTQSKTGNTANDMSWEVKEHVFGKAVRRVGNASLFSGKCAPPIVSKCFAVMLPWVAIRVLCPKIQVPLSKVYHKTTEVNRFAVAHLFFEHELLNQTSHGRKDV